MPKGKRRGHGEGSVYQRQDGRYTGYIRLDAGKKKYFYGSTRKEVQDKVRAALNEKELGVLATGPNVLLRDYLPEWLETVCKPSVRARTYANYRSVLNRHLIPAFGHLKIRSLTARHIQNFYAKRIAEGNKPGTIDAIHNVLSQALSNAVKWELVSRNVATQVTLPKGPGREIMPLTEEEAKRLLEVARGHRLEIMILLAVTTGMRRGEITALRWKDIDFETGLLYVKRTVGQVPYMHYVENEPKTQAGKRKIYLPKGIMKALQEQREHQEAEAQQHGLSFEEWNPKGLIICSKRRSYMHAHQTLNEFHKIVALAGLPKMHFHDLRHSAATILLAKGVHPKVVQELLGHASIAITMNIYSHVLPSLQKEVANIMDGFLSEPEDGEIP